ncbi:MAG: hypothetical protein NT167_25440, partial [Verrucomicrobia bacterium]|nr:hypothetical protein [Verrucomicrobiota bacterium]
LPEGWTPDRVPSTGTFQKGRITGGDNFSADTDAIRNWMFDNPHIMNLGRLRLMRPGGRALAPGDITGLARTLDLWTGLQTSHYRVAGQEVNVETCVHPSLDLVAVRIESPLVASGELEVTLDFAYPSLNNSPWVGEFSRTTGHATTALRRGKRRNDFTRRVDAVTYHAALAVAPGCSIRAPGPASAVTNQTRGTAVVVSNAYTVSARGTKVMAFVCAFSATPLPSSLPTFAKTKAASARRWEKQWNTGGAIDLSASKDARWQELERRIVLSQYLMAAMSAGSWPSSENGLLGIDSWRGQFHMEMVWWHLAHYALWGRWDQGDKAIGCYGRFAPAARELAAQLGYQGLKWQKSVGPEGRTAPWVGNQVLLWKQPHPIFFAELEYRLRPTRATLDKWADIVQGTAEHMADYPTKDETSGLYSLTPAMPPSEHRASPTTPCSISRIGAGAWTRPRNGGSAGAWRASRIGTRCAATWRRCRWWMASSSIQRNGRTPSPIAPLSIPIRWVFWACCRPCRAWMQRRHGARSPRFGPPGIGIVAGAGIFPGWRWPPRAPASRRSRWTPSSGRGPRTAIRSRGSMAVGICLAMAGCFMP